MRKFRVAVAGATGVVGQEMLAVLAQRHFPIESLTPLASERSAGRKVAFGDGKLEVQTLDESSFAGIDLALFSAGAEASRRFAPSAAQAGALVIDNSSAWRMDPEVPLCVPEVNIEAARRPPRGIIANPNCSTIQMLVALKPLHDYARVRRLVVATYQAISGAGSEALLKLQEEERQRVSSDFAPPADTRSTLAGNVLMHWKVEPGQDYQEEELKMIHETRKILGDPDIAVSPTAVRVPVATGHSEALTIEFERPISRETASELLRSAPGVRLVEHFDQGQYPTPLDVVGQDEVLVGRIREDLGLPERGLQMWVVGDNLRKGAALNAVQIAEQIFEVGK